MAKDKFIELIPKSDFDKYWEMKKTRDCEDEEFILQWKKTYGNPLYEKNCKIVYVNKLINGGAFNSFSEDQVKVVMNMLDELLY